MAFEWKGFNYDNWLSEKSGTSQGVGSASNLIKGVWNDWTGNTANRENIAYQNQYNADIWKRADTQYQRTVADLRSAGLSAQLAVGSPSTVAGASQAPNRTVGNESASVERLVGLVNSIKSTNASVKLTNAEADKATAEAGLYKAQLGSYGERTALEFALMRSQTALNGEYTKLAQIDGQTRAAYNISQIQSAMSTSKHNEALCRLVETQIDINRATENNIHADTALKQSQFVSLNKQIDFISEQIVSERFRQQYMDAETKYTLRQTTNAALRYVIDNATFQFKTELGDSPDSSEVSSTQSREARLAWKREMLKSLVGGLTSSVTSIATGVGMGFGMTFGRGAGGKFFNKMFGMDDHGPIGFHP